MSRFIDADAFDVFEYELVGGSSEYREGFDDGVEYVLGRIDNVPTADVVEVTRCRDCMHTEIDKYAPAECQNRCKLSQLYHEPTFFCKCGEPRMDLLEWIHRGDDDEQSV